MPRYSLSPRLPGLSHIHLGRAEGNRPPERKVKWELVSVLRPEEEVGKLAKEGPR